MGGLRNLPDAGQESDEQPTGKKSVSETSSFSSQHRITEMWENNGFRYDFDFLYTRWNSFRMPSEPNNKIANFS